MVSVLLHCSSSENNDELIAELNERGTTGIVEEGSVLEAFFDTKVEADAIAADFAAYSPILREHGDRDYVQEFRDQWQPALVGDRFWLVPAWETGEPPEGRLRIEYQPGMACGSGVHPCTRLCLQALEQCVQPGHAVLDVGVGSGILLMAARTLGAGMLAGCDLDYDTTVLAHSTSPQSLILTGSTDSLRSAVFDVVAANISSAVAEELFAELRRMCRPGGAIILSGFPEDDIPHIFHPVRSLYLEGWCCLIARG